MAIDKMLEQFKTLEELQAFAKAQQKTIVELSKKHKAQEEEIKHLKKLLEGAVPVINNQPKIDFSANDEEAIAREQLYKLKGISSERELTLEETKRYEIYSKILATFKDKNPKPIEVQSRNLSDAELLSRLAQPVKDDNDSDEQSH